MSRFAALQLYTVLYNPESCEGLFDHHALGDVSGRLRALCALAAHVPNLGRPVLTIQA